MPIANSKCLDWSPDGDAFAISISFLTPIILLGIQAFKWI